MIKDNSDRERKPADRERKPADRERKPADRERKPADRERKPAERGNQLIERGNQLPFFFMGYYFLLAARGLLYAPFHRQDSIHTTPVVEHMFNGSNMRD